MLDADIGAGTADLTGPPLVSVVGALAHTALADATATADLLVGGQTGRGVQRALARTARVVGVADAHAALAAAVS